MNKYFISVPDTVPMLRNICHVISSWNCFIEIIIEEHNCQYPIKLISPKLNGPINAGRTSGWLLESSGLLQANTLKSNTANKNFVICERFMASIEQTWLV
jgi:hypothetical protein